LLYLQAEPVAKPEEVIAKPQKWEAKPMEQNVHVGCKTSNAAAQAASAIVNCQLSIFPGFARGSPLSIVNFSGFATGSSVFATCCL
jgi:hypothetical protein